MEIYRAVVDWIAYYLLGDVASIVSLVITVGGFAVAIVNIRRSRQAAEEAASAARSARDEIIRLQTTLTLSNVIQRLDDVKTALREGRWRHLPERCSQLRGDLVNVRLRHPQLDERRQSTIQGAISQLSQLEYRIDRSLQSGSESGAFADSNRKLSLSLDELRDVLHHLETLERDR